MSDMEYDCGGYVDSSGIFHEEPEVDSSGVEHELPDVVAPFDDFTRPDFWYKTGYQDAETGAVARTDVFAQIQAYLTQTGLPQEPDPNSLLPNQPDYATFQGVYNQGYSDGTYNRTILSENQGGVIE